MGIKRHVSLGFYFLKAIICLNVDNGKNLAPLIDIKSFIQMIHILYRFMHYLDHIFYFKSSCT